MPLWTLTFEKVEELKRLHEAKNMELQQLAKITPSEMWLTDITNFMAKLDDLEREEASE